jgi:transcriptional regulator with GAF, ATPase, and Fis domain
MTTPLIGVSENIAKVRDTIKRVADSGLNVVIHGETGVGKEVVAKCLYYGSSRSDKPFVKVNCAALPDGLLESELYGYERGAFTGAERKRRGKFELANDGVLFLDEIGEMPLHLQAKLLHVLQNGEFSRLGSEKEIKTNVWVVAATNQDLEKAISNKTFREDLYYRLNTVGIYISPLRERPEDIPLLIDYYIEKYNAHYKNCRDLFKPNYGIMEKLAAYPWPGNVRELQNALKRIMVLGSWEEMIKDLFSSTETDKEASLAAYPPGMSIVAELVGPEDEFFTNPEASSFKEIRKRAVDEVEKKAILHILDKTNWNRKLAAKILQVSYKTVLAKISELNLERPPGSQNTYSRL